LIDIGREAHLKTSVGGLFHPGCLVCSACSTPLSGAYAIDDDGRAKCAKCQPTCDVCRQPLRGTYLLLDDGRSVHQECAPQHPCDGCGRNIDAGVPFMTAKNKEFHKGCMKCEMCHKANQRVRRRRRCENRLPRMRQSVRLSTDVARQRRRRRRWRRSIRAPTLACTATRVGR
jgi:hypothetical protein